MHDIVLASATDSSYIFAARTASLNALDALEGDPNFMTRLCNCRALSRLKKAEIRSLKKAHQCNIQDLDEKAVEYELVTID